MESSTQWETLAVGAARSPASTQVCCSSVRAAIAAGLRCSAATAAWTATNIGDQPQSFCPQNQKLIDVAGHDYASDGRAAIAMNENAIIVDMNPGFSVKVWVPFDVPPGTEVAVMELHDSAFSDGAWVNLK